MPWSLYFISEKSQRWISDIKTKACPLVRCAAMLWFDLVFQSPADSNQRCELAVVSWLSTVGRSSHFVFLVSSHLLSSCRWSPNHYSNTSDPLQLLLICIQNTAQHDISYCREAEKAESVIHTSTARNAEFVFRCNVASSFFRFLCRISFPLAWKCFGLKTCSIAHSVGLFLKSVHIQVFTWHGNDCVVLCIVSERVVRD